MSELNEQTFGPNPALPPSAVRYITKALIAIEIESIYLGNHGIKYLSSTAAVKRLVVIRRSVGRAAASCILLEEKRGPSRASSSYSG